MPLPCFTLPARLGRHDRDIAHLARTMAALIAALLVTARLVGFLVAAQPVKLPGGFLNPRTARHTLVGKTATGGPGGTGEGEDPW